MALWDIPITDGTCRYNEFNRLRGKIETIARRTSQAKVVFFKANYTLLWQSHRVVSVRSEIYF